MKYLGFFNKERESAYCLKEPLSSLYWFHQKDKTQIEDLAAMRHRVMDEIRAAMMNRIAAEVLDTAETLGSPSLTSAMEKAVEAYAKGETEMQFVQRLGDIHCYITPEEIIQYTLNPNKLLDEKATRYLDAKTTDELRRRWVAHCAAQQCLDQLVACAGQPARWNARENKNIDKEII